jgi:pimeloyl-ACP methyl ester carboxylesterase
MRLYRHQYPIHWQAVYTAIGSALLLIMSVSGIQAAEPDWANKLDPQTAGGQINKLNSAGEEVMTIMTGHSSPYHLGHVLILHGARQNPNWPDVIRPLRLALPKHGWSTLSLQMPVITPAMNATEHQKLMEKATAHIVAAISNLQQQQNKRIVLLGYGTGASMAVEWLSKTPQPNVAALIAISMTDDSNSGFNSNADLLNIRVPVLDVIGGIDQPAVIAAARERFRQRRKLKQYRQITIAGAHHDYRHHEDELAKRIRGWLHHALNISITLTGTGN